MAINPVSPRQEKMENPQTQPINPDVMKLMETGGKPKADPKVEKAKNDLRRVIQQVGIDPQRIIAAGKYAEAAIRDPKMYPIAVQMAIKENLISEEDIKKDGVDYKLLASGVSAGKLTQMLVDEGLV